MRSVKKALRLVFSITVFYAVALITLSIIVHPSPADVAVVLGNEVLANGKPSERLAARVDCALALYNKHLVHKIMVSGGKGANGLDEATAMANHLKAQNVPEQDIIIDSQGVNTMATATNAAKLMKEQQLHSAVIVTQYFHIPRTELAFLMAGVPSFSADYPVYVEWRDIPSIIREMVAIPAYLFTSYHQNN